MLINLNSVYKTTQSQYTLPVFLFLCIIRAFGFCGLPNDRGPLSPCSPLPPKQLTPLLIWIVLTSKFGLVVCLTHSDRQGGSCSRTQKQHTLIKAETELPTFQLLGKLLHHLRSNHLICVKTPNIFDFNMQHQHICISLVSLILYHVALIQPAPAGQTLHFSALGLKWLWILVTYLCVSSEVFIMIASVFELRSLLNYYAQQTVSRWGSTLIDTPFSAQMNLGHALVALIDTLFDLEHFSVCFICGFSQQSWSRPRMRALVFGQPLKGKEGANILADFLISQLMRLLFAVLLTLIS